MPQRHAAYDGIGSTYDDYASQATLKRAECYSIFEMVGDLAGLTVLDLACGTGFYTRRLKERGASSVLGVDLSPEMIEVAKRHERDDPVGVAYRVADVGQLGGLGPFDLVTAVWLLNYSETRDQLVAMAASACANVATGGRFVTFTINPEYDLRTAETAKYGVRIVGEEREDDHHVCHGEFMTNPPTPVDVRRFSREAYEASLVEAGFSEIEWVPAQVAAEDLDHYGTEYWRSFRENCIGIGIVARKR